MPVRVFAGRADRQVAFDNSQHCVALLRAHGVAAPLVDVGAVDHVASTLLAAPRVLAWFQRMG